MNEYVISRRQNFTFSFSVFGHKSYIVQLHFRFAHGVIYKKFLLVVEKGRGKKNLSHVLEDLQFYDCL